MAVGPTGEVEAEPAQDPPTVQAAAVYTEVTEEALVLPAPFVAEGAGLTLPVVGAKFKSG